MKIGNLKNEQRMFTLQILRCKKKTHVNKITYKNT